MLIDSPKYFALLKQFSTEDYPLPPGGTTDRLITAKRYQVSGPQSDLYFSTTYLEIDVALDSAKQWQGYWLEGHRRGDAAQKAAAQRALDAAARWQVLILWSEDDGKSHREVADAARRGDVRWMAEDYAPYTTPIPAFTWPNPDLQKLRSATRAPR